MAKYLIIFLLLFLSSTIVSANSVVSPNDFSYSFINFFIRPNQTEYQQDYISCETNKCYDKVSKYIDNEIFIMNNYYVKKYNKTFLFNQLESQKNFMSYYENLGSVPIIVDSKKIVYIDYPKKVFYNDVYMDDRITLDDYDYYIKIPLEHYNKYGLLNATKYITNHKVMLKALVDSNSKKINTNDSILYDMAEDRKQHVDNMTNNAINSMTDDEKGRGILKFINNILSNFYNIRAR